MKIFLLLLFLFQSWCGVALEVPTLTSPVVDLAGLLNSQAKSDLEQQLYKLFRSGKTQGQILIIKSLEGVPLEEFSIQVTDQWKLGDKEKDNGWLLLVSLEDRSIRLEVGQGLEGSLTDIKATRIIDGMKDYFRHEQYFNGFVFAINAIDATVEGKNYVSHESSHSDGVIAKEAIKAIFVLIFLIIIVVRAGLNSLRGRTGISYRPKSGWGGGGGFGSGGGFGGGFGGGWGGGGGGFSGGGSSGRW